MNKTDADTLPEVHHQTIKFNLYTHLLDTARTAINLIPVILLFVFIVFSSNQLLASKDIPNMTVAKTGDAKAEYQVGYYYEQKKGDYKEAVKWYQKAADQNYTDAFYRLGRCYEYGKGIGKNYGKAVKCFRQAVEQDHVGAQYRLGRCYELGKGVTKDYKKALKFYHVAANQDYVSAQYGLSRLYKQKGNHSEALKWYRLAAKQGHSKAKKYLLPEKITIEVKSGENIRPALQKAIDSTGSMKGKPVEIVIPKGQYTVKLDGKEKFEFNVSHKKNVTINGSGSVFVVKDFKKGFIIVRNSENITVKNMLIDWDPAPFTQGTVQSADFKDGSFIIKIDEGFVQLNTPEYKGIEKTWGSLKDPKIPGRLKKGSRSFLRYRSIEDIGDGKYKINVRPPLWVKESNVEKGDKFTLFFRSASMMGVFSSKNVIYENIINYAAPGSNYAGSRTDNLKILNCKLQIKKGRWQVSNADGVHVQSSRVGPIVENCVFEGACDDTINFYTVPMWILKKIDNRNVITTQNAPVKKGDKLFLFNAGEGSKDAEVRVVSVEQIVFNGGEKRIGAYRIELDGDLPENLMVTSLKGVKIDSSFHRFLPKNTHQFFNMNLNADGFRIRNNIFRNSRRFGALIKAHNGEISGNTYEGMSSSAIIVHNEPGWPEGLNSENIVIKDNIIKDCVFARHGQYAAFVIELKARDIKKRPKWRGQKGIKVLNNTFVNSGTTAIIATDCDGLVIEGNKFKGYKTPIEEGNNVNTKIQKNSVLSKVR